MAGLGSTSQAPIPGAGPLPDLQNMTFTHGPFAGMSMQEAYAAADKYAEQAEVVANGGKKPKEDKGITGNPIADMAVLGLGTGAVVGGGKALGQAAGGMFGSAAPAATQAATTGAAQTGASAATSAMPSGGGLFSSPFAESPAAWGTGPFSDGGAYASSLGSAGSAPPSSPGIMASMGLEAAPGTLGGSFLPALGVAAGAATGYQQFQGVKNALKGEDMSVMEEAALALPTFGASFLVDPVKDFFGSGKSKEQKGRDSVRGDIRSQSNIYNKDQEYMIDVGGGNAFDTRANGGKSYNIDWNQEGVGDVVGAIDPIVAALSSGKDKGSKSGVVGELTNAVVKGGSNKQDAINQIYASTGKSHSDLYQAILARWQAGEISAGERDAYLAALDKQFGIANPNDNRWDQQANLSEEEKSRNARELQPKDNKKGGK